MAIISASRLENHQIEQMTKQLDIPAYIDQLRHTLAKPVPGLAAQLQMAPEYRVQVLQDRTPPPSAKEASVLILLYVREGRLFFPLTQRTDAVETHKGQISLPGGAREAHETRRAAALRETCEELDICLDRCDILGQLTPLYIPPSGFLITPYIAYTATTPRFCPDPVEVAMLIETPLDLLLDPRTIRQEEWILHGTPVTVPFFSIHGHKVWGATAMVLSEFVTLISEVSL
jgi:8-oxo-dGTP pyrophosphatase MutT (NUDIX family)